MALIPTNFHSFAEVEAMYNNIKPLGGPKHKGQDVRPIGDRARKYERIVKISNDCYALSDGYHHGDAIFRNYRAKPNVSMQDMKRFAPIVWERFGQGVETVTIRNGIGDYMHTSRYMFLARHTPNGLYFIQTQQGKQFIRIRGTNTDLFLAKGGIAADGSSADTEDRAALVFRRDGSNWVFISNNGVPPVAPRVLVDKEAKAQYKEAIKEFCNWALTMAPMLNLKDWQVRHAYDIQFMDWLNENPMYRRRTWGRTATRANPELFRLIISDPTHPMRVVTLAAMMGEVDYDGSPFTDKTQLSAVRSKLNRWINQTLGFIKKG